MDKETAILLFSLAGFYHSNHGLSEEQIEILEDVYHQWPPTTRKELKKHTHWTMERDMDWLKED